jgi:TM2 domain-containing membrane protein YozV
LAFRLCLCLVLFLGINTIGSSQSRITERLESITGRLFFQSDEEHVYTLRNWLTTGDSSQVENPRLMAIVLDVTLGVLGMHRLYLGTSLKVPVFYALTLGGGGVLWIVDLGLLIFSKDIEKFKDNPKLFMWAE